jgi:hypothetical protein
MSTGEDSTWGNWRKMVDGIFPDATKQPALDYLDKAIAANGKDGEVGIWFNRGYPGEFFDTPDEGWFIAFLYSMCNSDNTENFAESS